MTLRSRLSIPHKAVKVDQKSDAPHFNMGGLATKRVRAVLQLLGLAGARWKRVVFPLRSEPKAFQSQRFPLNGVELAVVSIALTCSQSRHFIGAAERRLCNNVYASLTV